MPELLTETVVFNPVMLEHAAPGKLTKIRGMFQESNVVNANNRIYPHTILEREVGRLQDRVKGRGFYNQLDHSQSAEITLADSASITTRLWMEGSKVFGESEILTTPKGNLLKELFNCQALVGISSRAMGSTRESKEVPGCLEVCDDLSICAWDYVAENSVPGCTMSIAEAKQKYLYNANHYGIQDKDTRKALVEYVKQFLGEQKGK